MVSGEWAVYGVRFLLCSLVHLSIYRQVWNCSTLSDLFSSDQAKPGRLEPSIATGETRGKGNKDFPTLKGLNYGQVLRKFRPVMVEEYSHLRYHGLHLQAFETLVARTLGEGFHLITFFVLVAGE